MIACWIKEDLIVAKVQVVGNGVVDTEDIFELDV